MLRHKILGQVYTPNWIVCEILNLINYKGENILQKYILEPACGSGAFLCEIVKRYIQTARKNNICESQIITELETYVYGVELDTQAFCRAIENLNNITKKQGIRKKIVWNLFNENTLFFYKKNNSKFDFIVGNPPYIRIHNLDFETRKKVKNEFKFSIGMIDMYVLFFEMGFKMLKKNGLLGYITPNSYLHNSSYINFREYLKEEKIVKTIIDFKSNQIFKNYTTYTAISIFSKNNPKSNFNYKELIDGKISLVNLIKFNNLNKQNWILTNRKSEQFLMQLKEKSHLTIKDFFNVQYGLATLRDKIYIGKITDYSKTLVEFNGELVEKTLLKIIIKGSKFKGEINTNNRILFPYEEINNRYFIIPEDRLKTQYPNTYNYLLKNKTELKKRNMKQGALWYEFGRSQGLQTIHNEKIVVNTFVNGSICFYKIPQDIMVYSGLFITKNNPSSKWNVIEKILSSDDFYRYISLAGKDFSGGYKSLSSKLIKNFKIN